MVDGAMNSFKAFLNFLYTGHTSVEEDGVNTDTVSAQGSGFIDYATGIRPLNRPGRNRDPILDIPITPGDVLPYLITTII